ncbi:TPA: class C sortase [Streptococcus suis]|nr:class C sortase [Streptococcus suis]
MNWFEGRKFTAMMTALFLLGLGLLLYPSFSDYWNSFHQSQAILDYVETVSNLDATLYKEALEDAEVYNQQLIENGIDWNMSPAKREVYHQVLNLEKNGIMGYISIPKIDVKLSIFHGTNEDVLQTSIGHLEQTSLPIGGIGSHSVLSGHRGLPSAKLFSDLDKLKEGDTFTIHVFDQTITYEVDQIRVVEPTNLSDIQLVEGMDYCTLVTCTPYGVNSHRLLVRGHRIENADGTAALVADAMQLPPLFIAPFLSLPLLAILLLYVLVVTSDRYNKKKRIYLELKQFRLQDWGLSEK